MPLADSSLTTPQALDWPPHVRAFIATFPHSLDMLLLLHELGAQRALAKGNVPGGDDFVFVWKGPGNGRPLPLVIPKPMLHVVQHQQNSTIGLAIDYAEHGASLRTFLHENELGHELCASHCFGSAFLAGWHSILPGSALR